MAMLALENLSSDDVHARHTTDDWRFFFNILNRHFDRPHYYWHQNHHFHPLGADPAILYTFNYTNASGKHCNIGCPTSGTPLRPANIGNRSNGHYANSPAL